MKTIALVALTAVGLSTLSVGGTAYYRYMQLQEKNEYFNLKFNELKNKFPQYITIDKVSDSTMTETNTTYTINVTNPINPMDKNASKLIIKSNIQHGFDFFMNGEMNGTLKGNLEGEVQKLSKLNELFTSTIKIQEDFKVIVDTTFTNIKDASFNVNGITSHFENEKDSDNIKIDFKVNNVNGGTIFDLNGLSMGFEGNPLNVNNQLFSMSIGNIKSSMFELKGFSTSSKTMVVGNDFNSNLMLKVNKVTSNQDNLSVDFALDMKKLDYKTLAKYKEFRQAMQNPAFIKDLSKDFIANGGEFNLNKFNLKYNDEEVNLKLNVILPKVDKYDNFNFKNVIIKVSYAGKGKITDQIRDKLTQYGFNVENTDGQYIFDFVYEKEVAKLNNTEITKEQDEILKVILDTVDLHIKKSIDPDKYSNLEPINTDSISQTTEQAIESPIMPQTDTTMINSKADVKIDANKVENVKPALLK